MTISPESLEATQAIVAALAIGLSVVALPVAVGGAFSDLARRERLVLAGAVAVAALLRWVVAPHEMVTAFVGFKLTEHAIALLPVPHYGIGGTALYHAVFTVFPADHATIIATNAVLGVLAVPLAASWAGAVLADRRAGLVAGWLVATVPLLVRNDTSDALQVPLIVALLGGGALLARSARARWAGLPAVPLLVLAGITRPEGALLVAIVVAVTLLATGGRRFLVLSGALVAAALVPHLLHCWNAVEALRAQGGLPGYDPAELTALPSTLLARDVLLRPRSFPVGLTVLSAVALVLRGPGRRRVDVALAAGALLAVGVTAVDLDEANIERVQTPAAVLALVLAAGGASRLAGLVRRRAAPVSTSITAAALATGAPTVSHLFAAAALATGAPSVPHLFAASNEATEERLIRAALAALPAGPFTLLRLGEDDRRLDDPGATHVHFPDYLFRPPVREGSLRSFSSFLADPDRSQPTYVFWGMRCYARFRTRGTPAPHGTDLHPICSALRGQHHLVPVVEWDATNHGDVRLALYGDAPVLRVGLYRITDREDPAEAAPEAPDRGSGANGLSR